MTAASIAGIGALHFLRPHWLWLLLAWPLLAWWWQRRRQARSAWRDVVDAHLLPHLLDARGAAQRTTALWLLLLAWLLASCALAGPSWRMREQPLLQAAAPRVIALDLSSATLATDLPPSRLLQARAAIAALLRQSGRPVGLVVFADDAYTVAPLTDDSANVAVFLDALSPDVMPVDGSRADRAIALSMRLLRQGGYPDGEILLLGDRADAAARKAATEAVAAGYRVSVLGLGTAAGAAYRTADGRIVQAHLDADGLRALARAGNGRYAALTAGDRVAALAAIDAASHAAAHVRGKQAGAWQDEGYWLLPPLLLLLLLAFRRNGAFAMLLACLLLPLSPAPAQAPASTPMPAAARAARGTLWRRADQVQHARMQRAEDAYRRQDYAAAIGELDGLRGADADYNRGNALAQAGRYADALAAYDRALHERPRMADALANRKAVAAAMRRKPPSGGQQPPRAGQDKGQPKPDGGSASSAAENEHGRDKQNRDRQDQGRQEQGKHARDQAGQANTRQERADEERADAVAKGRPGNPSVPSPTPPASSHDAQPQQAAPPTGPVDAAAQQQADAAQRARMQRALQQQARGAQPGVQDKAAPMPRERLAEREKRAADNAWLRRVPDDPGGLLRARFRLEYERRQQDGERR